MKTCVLLIASLLILNVKAFCQVIKKDTCACSYSYHLGGLGDDEKIEKSGNVVISIKIDSAGFLGHPVIDSSLCPACDKAALKMVNSMIAQLNECYKKGCSRWSPPNSTIRQVIAFEKDEDE